ncbi:N,N-dimethylformamidase beta subunit family domain-containing protein [Kribbella jejuensis]|uniref:N,N-dimethylformamidase beta subunit family domain-containing protein n=1 Tax=Kribbella jejuensis TaxID=236068 RepID=UPI001EE1598E|nr:N,N-dimethylformamidase beta subunit family domain-containing protein [Kribbella jejuensis]
MRRGLVLGATMVLLATGCKSTAPTSQPAPASQSAPTSAPATTPSAVGPGVVAENAKRGTTAWKIDTQRIAGPLELAGYADHVSVRSGQPFKLFVTSTAGAFTVRAFRIGWYGGTGGRLVWTSPSVPGRVQPAAVVRPSDHLVTTTWQPSLTVPTTGWPAGAYLLLLTAADGKQKYVPLTVRSESTQGAVAIVNAVNTYEAYNEWGGYSLYNGPDKSFASRAHRVTFNRPYDGNGARTLVQSELPLIQLAERSGVRLAYLTSVDLATDPNALSGARGVVSLGHDEYWTVAMRDAVTKARDSGTNVAFLGANAVYWRVRYEAGNRVIVGYKDATLDPLRNRPDTTAKWRSKPDPRPENSLTGMLYECFPAVGSFTVRDPDFFLYAGTGARKGSAYPGLTATEVDRAYPIPGTPKTLQVVAHSPVSCGPTIHTFSDATYYTTPSGAGVFDTGSMNWVPSLHGPNSKHSLTAREVAFARTVTVNLLRAMSAGPLARTHPAQPDLNTLGASASTSTGSGGSVG